MGLARWLNWSTEKRDGTPRSFIAQVLDPVGVCLQPAAIDPYTEPELPAEVTAADGEVITDGSDEAAQPPPPLTTIDETSV